MSTHRRRLPTAANFAFPRQASTSQSTVLGPRSRDGKLHIEFRPTPGEEPHVLDCTEFMSRPKLAPAEADFIFATQKLRSRDSRENIVKYFRYFSNFLDHLSYTYSKKVNSLEDICTNVLDLYIKWLDGDSIIKSKLSLSVSTRKARYKVIYRFLDWCRKSSSYSAQISKTLFLQPNPWANAHLSVVHHEALSKVQVAQIRLACTSEIKETLAKLYATKSAFLNRDLLNSTTPYEKSVVHLKGNVHRCLRHLHTVIADGHITKKEMSSQMPGLARVVVPPYFVFGEIIPSLYITPRSIVPFVILMAFHTAFNPAPLLDLRWGNITRQAGSDGKDRWCIQGDKRRGNSGPQSRTFPRDNDNRFGAISLLVELRRFNTRIKMHLTRGHTDSVFVFWKSLGTQPSGFINHPSRKISGLWDSCLARFIQHHGLPRFTLANIRSSVGDLVDFMSEGDIEAQQTIQQHRSKKTTEASYQTRRAKTRRAEQLAEGMDQRQRVIDSTGKISFRTNYSKEDMTAATPGFRCWEPRASPIPGQKEGKLCSAYGECPLCPLSYIHLEDPFTVPRFLQLKAAFEVARDRMNPQRWWIKWQPAYEALTEDWFPRIPDVSWQKSTRSHLPPIPAIE